MILEWYWIAIIVLLCIVSLLIFIMVKIQLENNSLLIDTYNELREYKKEIDKSLHQGLEE